MRQTEQVRPTAALIHPAAIVDAEVVLSPSSRVGARSVLHAGGVLETGCWIGSGSVLGGPPEWSGDDGETVRERADVGYHIAARAIVRDNCVLHGGAERATFLGSDAHVMSTSYVAHDCFVEDRAVVCHARLAGRVHVMQGAMVGSGAALHQHTVVGTLAMIGMGSVVVRPVPPFALAMGVPARVVGANVVGLRRAGIAAETIDALDRMHRGGGSARLEPWVESELDRYERLCDGSRRWADRGAIPSTLADLPSGASLPWGAR